VFEAQKADENLTMNAAAVRLAPRVGVNKDTLYGWWCKQAAIDRGDRPGTTTADAKRVRELEAEVRELKRANEILLAASSFFARELDPRLPW
jgi:transposase-like protein